MLTCKTGPVCGVLDITGISIEGRSIVNDFRHQMTLYDYAGRKCTLDAVTGKKVYSKPEIKTRFFLENDGKVYLPLEPLDLLCRALDNRHIDIKHSRIPAYDIPTIDLSMDEGITLYERQEAAIEKIDKSGKHCGLIGLNPGSGKAITDTTLVPTPNGFKPHGSLVVGDQVIGSNGHPTDVLEVFKHPSYRVYTVAFSDGTSMDCCKDHLWTVIDITEGMGDSPLMSNDLKVRVYTVEELLNLGLSTNDPKGDGGITQRFSIPKHKGVMKDYAQRLSLYKDFIATHGENFASSDKVLVDSFLRLARSLGLIYSSVEDTCGDGKTCYLVNRLHEPRGKRIVSITKTSRMEAMSCITVSSPDRLYMVGDHYTLTHNTFTALAYASRRKKPVMIFSKSSYLVQWNKDIKDVINVPGKTVFITSTDMLISVLKKASEGDIPDVILLSLATYRSYVTRWLNGDERIEIAPPCLASTLKLGTVLADEVHTELNALWMLLSLTNVPLILGLSGTMSSDDPLLKVILRYMFPLASSYFENSDKGYIDLIHYYYRLEYPNRVITSPRGRNSYSHIAYEKYILRNKKMTRRYCSMVDDAFTKAFLGRRKTGDKCLIFVTKIDMAEVITRYLRSKHEDLNLNYINFTGSVTKDDVLESDVLVSTIGKSGTAMDHHGLTTLINTVAVFKKETAIQNIQRLRRPKMKRLPRYHDYMDDRKRVCVQFICTDIPSHVYFAKNRLSAIRKVVDNRIDAETCILL